MGNNSCKQKERCYEIQTRYDTIMTYPKCFPEIRSYYICRDTCGKNKDCDNLADESDKCMSQKYNNFYNDYSKILDKSNNVSSSSNLSNNVSSSSNNSSNNSSNTHNNLSNNQSDYRIGT